MIPNGNMFDLKFFIDLIGFRTLRDCTLLISGFPTLPIARQRISYHNLSNMLGSKKSRRFESVQTRAMRLSLIALTLTSVGAAKGSMATGWPVAFPVRIRPVGPINGSLNS